MLAVAVLIHLSSLVGRAEERTQPLFVFDFMGKGTRAFWDIGVITAAYELIPRIQSGDVVYAGNSSGSVFATYFSCWGVSRESTAYLYSTLMQYLVRPELQMDPKATMKKLRSSFFLISKMFCEFPSENSKYAN